MYSGDMAPLCIGAGLLIIVYLTTDVLIRRRKQKITYHADIAAPIIVFLLSIAGFFMIGPIQEWALLLPFIMLIAVIPVSILLTVIKTGTVLKKKIKL